MRRLDGQLLTLPPLVAGDDGTNAVPLQLSGSDLKITLDSEAVVLGTGSAAIGKLAANSGVDIGDVDVLSLPSLAAGTNAIGKLAANSGVDIGDVTLTAGTAAIGKLAANSGVDIGDVDVTSLPAGNIGQQAMAASLSTVPASNIGDATYIGDIKFGESLPAGTAAIGKLAANSGVDIGDVDVLSLPSLPAGTNAIGKLAANSGVDIGDVDVTSITPGTAAGNLGKAEDAAHVTGDTGVMSLVVRNDAGAALAADGDYIPLMVNASGALYVTGGGGGTEYVVNAAAPADPTGTATLMERDDALTTLTEIEGDWTNLRSDSTGALWVRDTNLDDVIAGSEVQVDIVGALPAGTAAIGKLAANSGVDIGDVDVTSIVPGTGATSLGKAEDAVHGSGDTGLMTLAVRNDAGTAMAADGDYIPLMANASGALYVTGGGGGTEYVVNAAAPADPTGTATLMERDDALTTLTEIEGDWTNLRGTAEGALWTQDFNSDAMLTALQLLDNAIAGNEMQVDVVASLPAGTNAIGKLAANSGVDIGDVDVLSLPALATGSNAIGKLAANSGVDIGDVDVTSLPAGNLGQQAMAASLSTVPASNITDATYIGDIKFGEALPAGTAAIGKLAANSGVDIGDVDVLSLPSLAAGTNAIGK
ncbi:MAG: hypothetical protein ACYTAO_21500, partial [Planctomycetota bacterium]